MEPFRPPHEARLKRVFACGQGRIGTQRRYNRRTDSAGGPGGKVEFTLSIAVPATGAQADVVVRAPTGCTLGQVSRQLLATVSSDPATGTLYVDGAPVSANALLGYPPLLAGVRLEVDSPRLACSRPGAPELHVVGGPDAGGIHPLLPGETIIGRAGAISLDDPDVSREHCALRLAADGATVHDLASTNGTWVDGTLVPETVLPYGALLRIGESTLELCPPASATVPVTAPGDGQLAYNRPPRLRPARSRVQVSVPAPPPERERSPLPLLATLAPLVLGVVMWRVLGNANFLLFTLLTPIMAIANLITERRAGRRQSRRQQARWQAARTLAEATLADAVRADEQRRRTAAPDAAMLLLLAGGPRPRLWERRRGDDDALDLRLGLGDQAAVVEADGDVPAGATTARNVPVVVPLRTAGVLGLAGSRARVEALARWSVVQAAVLHSPRDLQIVVLTATATAASWEWARWLPHTVPAGRQNCRATLGLGTTQAAERIAELMALVEGRRAERAGVPAPARSDDRPVLLVLDGAHALRSLPGLPSLLSKGPGVNVFAVAIETDALLLPEECGATAVLSGEIGDRLVVTVADQPPRTEVTADLVTPAYAEEIARALAPLRDDSRERDLETGLPTSIRWTQVADLPLTGGDDDVIRLLTRWAAPGRTTTAVLGRGPNGTFCVDLARDGPHALVAGTTGSGKSELLQTLIASLAAGNRPDELTFVLVDYKGGAAFGPCARLPHTVGLVTDLDGALVERAIASLRAELRRREAMLAAAGVKDIDDHRRQTGKPLPRLVLVVDEFAALAEELPDFLGGLVAIAQRGRSLGVHLVLATQRPEGVVSADIRANANLRICLAVARDAESRDVIDSPAAAAISRATPGRAYARTGHAELTTFQAGRVGGPRLTPVAHDEPPTVIVVPAAEVGDPMPIGRNAAISEGVTDLSLLVEACATAATRLGLPAQRSPWLAPLPVHLTLEDVRAEPDPLADRPGRVPPLLLGLCDVPDEQARRPLILDLDMSSHLMVVGSARSGRTTLLRTLAGALTAVSADDVHLYALDPGGTALGPLAALPHAGAVVCRDQPERLERVLSSLAAQVQRRQVLLAAHGHGDLAEQRAVAAPADRLPHLLLLLDRWEAFLTAYQDVDGGRLVDLVFRLLREGPAAGLHVVLTADRSGIVGRVATLVQERLLLRLADPGDYAAAGLPTRLVPAELTAGRGWSLTGRPLVAQVALLDPDPSGVAQTRALQRLAAAAPAPVRCRPRRVEPLPEAVQLAALPRTGGSRVVLGVGGDELTAVEVDLAAGFVIAGPTGAGRSSALLTIAHQLANMPVVAVAPRPSPLRALPGCLTDLASPQHLAGLLGDGPVALILDDAELLADCPLTALLDQAVRGARDTGSLIVAAGTTEDLILGYRGFLVELRRARIGLLLSPQSAADGDLFGVRLSRAAGGPVQPGRGLLALHGRAEPIQVALAG